MAELSPDECRRLAKDHPELDPVAPAVVVSGDGARFLARYSSGRGRAKAPAALWEEGESEAAGEVAEPAAVYGAEAPVGRAGPAVLDRLIEALTPDLQVPSLTALAQARRSAVARVELAQEFGLFSSAQVADLAGSTAKNRAALANRWKQEGRVFTVPHRGQQLWPGFQFDTDGQPLTVIEDVLGIFEGSGVSPWAMALWFTGPSGWLDGRRPVDLLESEAEAVVEAARLETAESFF
ncbi:MAG: antitoxin Xre/MbcA/ParS toxin-binding domain-containing protein [Acidobacteriota bacterium]|nr:antitoxin Xre/MbcA/ParS toxin-binding domain-containing protein [Acidobacteriota bacterium]